jgi:ATP-dependent DNA helicase RecG
VLKKQLLDIISSGEGLTIEFKECSTWVNRDVYESICAFLNRQGGHLFLGVKNDGTIAGIILKQRGQVFILDKHHDEGL